METTNILLYAANVAPLEDADLFAAVLAAVSPARREAAKALQRPADKRRCLAAGLLLRRVLGTAAEPLFGPQGKPYLPGGPEFSLSHSGDWVLCAVADRAVGCDVQRMDAPDLRMAARRFAPEETADILAQVDPEAQAERFYRYWVLKESFVKAVGLGMRLPFRDFRIDLTIPVTVTQRADPRAFGFAEFGALPGHRCAVCAENGCGDVRLEVLPLPIPKQ